MLQKTLLILLACCVFSAVDAAITADKVLSLGNYTDLSTANFDLYSGMITLDNNPQKRMHYIFSTANKSGPTPPTSLPLIVWLNGGPGCSSVDGWVDENGPYIFIGGNGTINNTRNPWTWNNIANLLYLESPLGVGFSQAPPNYLYTDEQTCSDQYQALSLFLQGFSEFNHTEVYIAGESYAGIYVPNLAARIVQQNKNKGKLDQINLQGIIAGNPVTNTTHSYSNIGTNQFLHNRYLITDDAYNGFIQNCYGVQDNQTSPSCQFWNNFISNMTMNINPYNVYGYCYYSPNDPASEHRKKTSKNAPWFRPGADSDSPCTTAYGAWLLLNNPANQAALHVPPTNWSICNDSLVYGPDLNGSITAYWTLMANNVPIYVLSGDADSVVPYTDTLYWLEGLNLPVAKNWAPWNTPDGQIGGFIQSYAGLNSTSSGINFITVRAAGHMIPEVKPLASFTILQSILNKKPLN